MRIMRSCALTTTEDTSDSAAEATKESVDRARGALLQGAAMNRTQLRRNRVAVLVVLGVRWATFDRMGARDVAELCSRDVVWRREAAGREIAGRALHELRPDRQ